MRSFRAKPIGWRGESYRHYLASRGVRTYDARLALFSGTLSEYHKNRAKGLKHQAEEAQKQSKTESEFYKKAAIAKPEVETRQNREAVKRQVVAFAPAWVQADYASGEYDDRLRAFKDASDKLNDLSVDERRRAREKLSSHGAGDVDFRTKMAAVNWENDVRDAVKEYRLQEAYFKKTAPSKRADPMKVPRIYDIESVPEDLNFKPLRVKKVRK